METVCFSSFSHRIFYHDFQRFQRQFFFHRWAELFTKLKKSICYPRVSLFNLCFNPQSTEFLYARSLETPVSCMQEIVEYTFPQNFQNTSFCLCLITSNSALSLQISLIQFIKTKKSENAR